MMDVEVFLVKKSDRNRRSGAAPSASIGVAIKLLQSAVGDSDLIEYIRGTLSDVTSAYIVVDNGGIGYLIYCPNPYSFLPIGAELTVFTYQYVREDAIHLYGFKTREERDLFIHLLSVSGIGPKGALAIVASGEPGRVAAAIENEDERFLTKFPGVGKKTARQMILDLKGKLGRVGTAEQAGVQPAETNRALDDAVQALYALGYSDKEIRRILPELEGEPLATDEYVRKALRLMLNQ